MRLMVNSNINDSYNLCMIFNYLIKYLFTPYIIIILYAASLGRESVPSILLKEYLIFMLILIIYDFFKLAILPKFQK
jgi:hypothetical protein